MCILILHIITVVVVVVVVHIASNIFLCFVDEITSSFRRFGHLVVDWPHKAESKSYFPPKGINTLVL